MRFMYHFTVQGGLGCVGHSKNGIGLVGWVYIALVVGVHAWVSGVVKVTGTVSKRFFGFAVFSGLDMFLLWTHQMDR